MKFCSLACPRLLSTWDTETGGKLSCSVTTAAGTCSNHAGEARRDRMRGSTAGGPSGWSLSPGGPTGSWSHPRFRSFPVSVSPKSCRLWTLACVAMFAVAVSSLACLWPVICMERSSLRDWSSTKDLEVKFGDRRLDSA